MNCERCKQIWAEPRILIGGRHTALCNDCLTAWHKHIRGTVEWIRRTELNAKCNALVARAFAGGAPSEDEWLRHHAEVDKNHETLFDHADAWLRESQEAAPALSPPPEAEGPAKT